MGIEGGWGMKKNIFFCIISLLYLLVWGYYSKVIEIAQGGNGLGGALILCYAAIIYTIFEILFVYKERRRLEVLFYILIYIVCIFAHNRGYYMPVINKFFNNFNCFVKCAK